MIAVKGFLDFYHTFSLYFLLTNPDNFLFPKKCTEDKRVIEIDYQLKYAIFSTACSTVYKYCTRPISKHLYSGIFKDPLDTKHKIFKKRLNS